MESFERTDAETIKPLEIPRVSAFDYLKLQVEAILFAAESPLDLSEIRGYIGDVAREDVRTALRAVAQDTNARAYFLFESGGRYQLRTRPEWSEIVSKHYSTKPRNLSKAAIETLAVVAYRQPVTRAEINAIRGTDSASIVAALKEKDLIAVAGVRKEVGNPLEFKTTARFLEVFGLGTLKELPSLRSLQMNPDKQKQIAQSLAELDNPPEPPTASELSFSEGPEPI